MIVRRGKFSNVEGSSISVVVFNKCVISLRVEKNTTRSLIKRSVIDCRALTSTMELMMSGRNFVPSVKVMD